MSGFYTHPVQRQLNELDNKMAELLRLDAAKCIGRDEGRVYEMQMRSYYEGRSPQPEPIGRTPEYRLARHYEKQWNKINRSWK